MQTEASNVSNLLLPEWRSEGIAVVDRDGPHTYADLQRATTAVADRITSWDLARGSRVGLLSRNSFYWVAAYLAILRCGHVVVPFATALTAQDLLRKAEFVGCEAYAFDSGLRRDFGWVMEGARHVLDETALPSPHHPGEGPAGTDPAGMVGSTNAGTDGQHRTDTTVHREFCDPDDDAVLMFTSGTTSAPRAVRVSHRNIEANTKSIVDYLGLTTADRTLVVLPFSYCYGASLLHTHLSVGASLAICDTFAFPETAIEQIQRDECTGLAGVPSTYQLLLRASSFESTSLPSLRIMQQAGGRLPPRQVERVCAAQPHADLFVMYGATEATARLSYLPPALREERRGSIGRGIPGVTLSIVDEGGTPVATGTVGEIFARGDNITKGYWQDPSGTAAKFVDGGLLTGDLARADEDGFLYVVDRQADFIKSWGIRVSSHEIEDAVVTLEGVTAAAAVGRPDEDAGESIVLFYVAAPDAEVTDDQVLTHCRSILAKHLVPDEVRRMPELPLNQNGKTLKAQLRAMATTQP